MNRQLMAGGLGLLLAGLAALLLWPVSPAEVVPPPVIKRAAERPVIPAPPPRPGVGEAAPADPEVNDDPNHADNEPMFTEEELIERRAIDARLALPPAIEVRFGSWDGSQPTPARLAVIEDLIDRALTDEEVETFKELFIESQEDAALATGRFRQGLKTEAETVKSLDAAEAYFRGEVQGLLGLDDDQYQEAFGLGTAE